MQLNLAHGLTSGMGEGVQKPLPFHLRALPAPSLLKALQRLPPEPRASQTLETLVLGSQGLTTWPQGILSQ